MSWKNLTVLFIFTLALSAISSLFGPSKAMACRDCPFPMKIGQNEWLFPDSDIVVLLDETDLTSTKVFVRVTLRDSISHVTLASGSGVRHRHQRNFTLVLHDPHGRRLNGSMYWVRFDDPVIRMRFSCMDDDCSIVRRR